MKKGMERFPILHITEESKNEAEAVVTKESSLTIILNNQEVVTLLCTPTNLEYLAIGFLFSEGLLESKDEIKKIVVDDERGIAVVETKEDKEFSKELLFKKRSIHSGGGTIRGASFSTADVKDRAKVESQIVISSHEVFELVNKFQYHSQLFQITRGVHSAALCDTKNILVFSDDLGRHNAIDKIFGECLLKDIATDDRIVITTGRVPSEQLIKVAKRKIPIMISLTVPTDLGVRLAADFGITLIGSVRSEKMDIYTNDWRVVAK